MSLELWFHPDAEAELTDAAHFYAQQDPGLDTRFIAEFERALGQIVRFPEAASPGPPAPNATAGLSVLAHLRAYRHPDPCSGHRSSEAVRSTGGAVHDDSVWGWVQV